MASDLKPMMSKLLSSGGAKKFHFAFGTGKRKDGKGDGELLVRDAKPKKTEIEGELADCKEVVEGVCWVGKGGDDDGAVFLQGKSKKLSAMLVAKMALTAKRLTGRQFDFQLPSAEEESRVADVADGDASAAPKVQAEAKPAVKAEAKPAVKAEVPAAKPETAVEDAQERSRLWNELGALQAKIVAAIQTHPQRKADVTKLYDGIRDQLRIGQGGTVEEAGKQLGELTSLLASLDGAPAQAEVKPAVPSADQPDGLAAPAAQAAPAAKPANAVEDAQERSRLWNELGAMQQKLVAAMNAHPDRKADLVKLYDGVRGQLRIGQGGTVEEAERLLGELTAALTELGGKGGEPEAKPAAQADASSQSAAPAKQRSHEEDIRERSRLLSEFIALKQQLQAAVDEHPERRGEIAKLCDDINGQLRTGEGGTVEEGGRLLSKLLDLLTKLALAPAKSAEKPAAASDAADPKELQKRLKILLLQQRDVMGRNGGLKDQLLPLSQAASNLVVKYKTGTPAQAVTEALDKLEEALKSAPAAAPAQDDPQPSARPAPANAVEEAQERSRLWNELGTLQGKIGAAMEAQPERKAELVQLYDAIRAQLRIGQGGSLEEGERLLGELTKLLAATEAQTPPVSSAPES